MKLSLVLATYGRTDDLARLVQSLSSQSWRSFELVVVDQNTDERVAPYVRQAIDFGIHVEYLRLDRPGLSAARNVGLAAATGDLVAFPDDDCWYEPETLVNVIDALTKEPKWSGLVGTWVERQQVLGIEQQDNPLSLARWRDFKGGDASSITLFLRTDLVRQLKGFDERLGVGRWYGAGEETDLVMRALQHGAVIGRSQHTRIHHRFDPPGRAQTQPPWEHLVQRARGTGALYVKHRLLIRTIARGLVGPPLRALASFDSRALRRALAGTLGRCQGALYWMISER